MTEEKYETIKYKGEKYPTLTECNVDNQIGTYVFSDGSRVYARFHKNGTLHDQSYVENGNFSDLVQNYNDDGLLSSEEFYKKPGKPTWRKTYSGGKIHGYAVYQEDGSVKQFPIVNEFCVTNEKLGDCLYHLSDYSTIFVHFDQNGQVISTGCKTVDGAFSDGLTYQFDKDYDPSEGGIGKRNRFWENNVCIWEIGADKKTHPDNRKFFTKGNQENPISVAKLKSLAKHL